MARSKYFGNRFGCSRGRLFLGCFLLHTLNHTLKESLVIRAEGFARSKGLDARVGKKNSIVLDKCSCKVTCDALGCVVTCRKSVGSNFDLGLGFGGVSGKRTTSRQD